MDRILGAFRHWSKARIVCAAVVLAIPSTTPAAEGEGASTLPPSVGEMPTPVLDGKIDAAEWKDAFALGKLKRDKEVSVAPSEAWVGLGKEAFYFAVRCEEPQPKKIKNTIIADEQDGAIWSDDCVELMIDPGGARCRYFHLAFNTKGTRFDGEVVEGQMQRVWESGATAAARVGEASWEIEVAVPFSEMGWKPGHGEGFALNVGRERYAGSRPEYTSLLGGVMGQHPERFLPFLAMGPLSKQGVRAAILRRALPLASQEGVWEYRVENASGEPKAVRVSFPKEPSRGVNENMKPGETHDFRVTVPFARRQAMEESVLSVAGEEIYRGNALAPRTSLGGRVAVTARPLFNEVIEPFPEGLSRAGAMIWTHEIDYGMLQPLATQYGWEFAYEPRIQALVEERKLVILNTAVAGLRPDSPPPPAGRDTRALLESHGVKLVLFLDARGAISEGAPTRPWTGSIQPPPWMPDPRAVQAYLKDLDLVLDAARTNPNIWGIYAGDELIEQMMDLVKALAEKKSTVPELAAADEEIKKQYGFGQFGLPLSATDRNPYRWIATQRWMLAHLIELQKEVKRRVAEKCPRLKLVSWDNLGSPQPFQLGQWGSLFDIQTTQTYPSRDPDREDTGFLVALMADLTGSKEIWPCVHMENYSASFTPSEVEELLGQALRNGATGLHLFQADVAGGRSGIRWHGAERFGAPDRWQVVEALVQRMKEPFRVKRERADTAIYYSNTSYQGQGTVNTSREVEWIYTVLGPKLGCGVRFIDEYTLARGPEALSGFKAIYVPYAGIEDEPVWKALKEYAQKGGTLVLCDPEAFARDSAGIQRQDELLKSHRKPDDLGMVRASWGKGRIVSFKDNPLKPSVIRDKKWIAAFEVLQKESKARFDEPRWRFRLPPGAEFVEKLPSEKCLTGNAVVWRQSRPVRVADVPEAARWRFSEVPLNATERAVGQWIPAEACRLTDRRRGTEAPSARKMDDADKWVYRFDASIPLEVTCEVPASVWLKSFRILASGTLPAGVCEVASATGEWRKAAKWEAQENGRDILWLDVPLQAEGRQVRLSFEGGGKGDYTLVEAELWGASAAPTKSP